MRFAAEVLEAQAREVLVVWGVPEDCARTAATAMVYADLAGIDSHGISMLPTYEVLHGSGQLVAGARPQVVRRSGATALLDAGGGLGHPAGVVAMEMAAESALEHGIAAVSVRNSHHFGAAGYYARLAADRGLVGLVTTSARTVCVPPTRAAVPRLATNPIAFAAPGRRNRPLLLDMSTSTVAVNKVRVHGYTGRPLPSGWVVDGGGAPVTDPVAAMDIIRSGRTGGLTALGGTADMSSHKGYGLALMVHVLSATLCGASFAAARGPDDPEDIGHFFLALDPRAFREDGAFEEDLDDALDLLRRTPPTDPELPVLVPGDPEEAAREHREREGVPIADALHRQLREVCARAGAPFLLDPGTQ